MDELAILAAASRFHRDGVGAVLAVVVRTWGSAPRPAGSAMAIRADGAFVGSVSSGCVEAAVVARAAEVLRARTPCAMELGVDEETAWTVGLACGGRLEVALWPVEGAVAEAIAAVCALSERGEGAALELRVAGSDARALPAPSTNDDATHLELRAGQP